MKKIALITGASGLIGKTLCEEFLSEGYSVTGVDVRPSDLTHVDYTHLKGDVSKEKDVLRVFRKLKALDVLINNAARANPKQAPIEKLDLKDWEKTMAVDLTSVFLFSKHSIPLLRKSFGCIINISSTRHKMSEAHTEIYTAAKGGVDALTRSMAISLGPEIRVNSISPGWIASPRDDLSLEDHAQHPAGRVGRPADISSMAITLAHDKSAFITGQDFVIDGGMTAKMVYV